MRIKNNKKHNIKINYNIKINDKNIEPCEYCNEEPTIIRPENIFNNHLKIQIFNKYIYLNLLIIEYGDPDNSGKDLKGYNQVYLRSEIYLGWGILDADSFARVVVAG